MAYRERIEPSDATVIALPAMSAPSAPADNFSDLEWSIIRLAQVDALWTIRSPGRLARFWNWLLGRGNPELANPRLEALRKMAVLSWHYGFAVAGVAVADFLSAGFGLGQYELLVSSVTKASSWQRNTAHVEVLA